MQTDVEQFDKFVEKHWGNQLAKKETVTVSAETEENLKKRKKKENRSLSTKYKEEVLI